MENRKGLRISVLLNLLLVAAVVAIAMKEGYWSKAFGPAAATRVPVTETLRYRQMVGVHQRLISQAMAGSEVRVAFIGDSIIQGWLTSAMVPQSINLGIGGDTIPGLLARTNPGAIDRIPVWVLSIGANDARRGRQVDTIPDYVARLAASYGGAERLFWRAVLPVERDDWDAEMETFRTSLNTHSREACAEMENCTYLDAPRDYAENIAARSTDGLHPNVDGYRALTQQICAHLVCAPEGP